MIAIRTMMNGIKSANKKCILSLNSNVGSASKCGTLDEDRTGVVAPPAVAWKQHPAADNRVADHVQLDIPLFDDFPAVPMYGPQRVHDVGHRCTDHL
jgi:hypothetical protein